jgi:hypothetical protein
MPNSASCYGKWHMENGKSQYWMAFSIYHLPSSIEMAIVQGPAA